MQFSVSIVSSVFHFAAFFVSSASTKKGGKKIQFFKKECTKNTFNNSTSMILLPFYVKTIVFPHRIVFVPPSVEHNFIVLFKSGKRFVPYSDCQNSQARLFVLICHKKKYSCNIWCDSGGTDNPRKNHGELFRAILRFAEHLRGNHGGTTENPFG